MKIHALVAPLLLSSVACHAIGTTSQTPALRVDDDTTAPETPDPAASKHAFERLASLAGEWRGRSTKGWEDEVTIEVIAGGSVVVIRSFGAHPGETMLTLAHMDGERLLLKHYCVARNQPRYVARVFEDDGAKVTFEFLDGTNMASRDVGHMDGVVYRFLDDESFTSTWSWYQNGKVSWMEEIEHVRVD